MQSILEQIRSDEETIEKLQEFSFEAMEVYKKTLNLSQAIQKGQELADIQRRKEEARIAREKAEEARKAEERRRAEEQQNIQEEADVSEIPETEMGRVIDGIERQAFEHVVAASVEEQEPVMHLDFRVLGDKRAIVSITQLYE